MDFCLSTLATFFLLLAAASCAPAGLSAHDACADVRRSSLELNHISKIVSVEARNGSKDMTDFSSLVWMEAKDMCDPEALKDKSAPCLGKILDVLTSYISAVERVSRFQSCKKFGDEVKPAMDKLHKHMSTCVDSRAGVNHQKETYISREEPISNWQEPLLCHYTLDRLFSFSILSARVFAVGDPAQHTASSAQKCL